MITFLIILGVLCFSFLVNKELLPIKHLEIELVKGVLAVIIALALGAPFLLSIVGAYAGVHVAYIVIANKLKGKEIGSDDESLIGEFLIEYFGEKAGRVLFYAELVLYILAVLI